MGQIELFNGLLRIIIISWNHTAVWKLFVFNGNTWLIELLVLERNTWNHLWAKKKEL